MDGVILCKMVMSDDEILLTWDSKRHTAANSGTWMHAMPEHMLNGYKIEAGSMQGEMDAPEVYRQEWCICAPEEDLAGSIASCKRQRYECLSSHRLET